MRDELGRLDEVLASAGDPLARTLAPPASREAVDAAPGLPRPLPEEVREWFAWHDGLVAGRDADYDLVPGGMPLSLAEAAETVAAFQEVATQLAATYRIEEASLWDQRWLPVLSNSAGDLLVVTCDEQHVESSPVGYRMSETGEVDPAYDSLAALAITARQCWESGAYRRGEEGLVEDDRDSVAEVWARHNPLAAAAHPAGPPLGVVGSIGDLTEPDEAVLLAQMGGADPSERAEGAVGLARAGNPAALSSALALLGDASAALRWTAAEALGELGEPAAAPYLVAALRDPEAQVRCLAADALGKLGPDVSGEVVPALREAAREDGDPSVRRAAADALARLEG